MQIIRATIMTYHSRVEHVIKPSFMREDCCLVIYAGGIDASKTIDVVQKESGTNTCPSAFNGERSTTCFLSRDGQAK